MKNATQRAAPAGRRPLGVSLSRASRASGCERLHQAEHGPFRSANGALILLMWEVTIGAIA